MDQVRRRAAMDIHSADSSGGICAGGTHASCIGALLLALLALCLYNRVERTWYTAALKGSFH